MLILFCMRGCGRSERPAFPAPSDLQKAGRSQKNSRETRGEIAKLRLKMPRRHCEERSDEAIHSSYTWRDGLLRFARNDGLKLLAGLFEN
jgi:hypothetical protein